MAQTLPESICPLSRCPETMDEAEAREKAELQVAADASVASSQRMFCRAGQAAEVSSFLQAPDGMPDGVSQAAATAVQQAAENTNTKQALRHLPAALSILPRQLAVSCCHSAAGAGSALQKGPRQLPRLRSGPPAPRGAGAAPTQMPGSIAITKSQQLSL